MVMMRSDLHDRLLIRLRKNNLPQPEVPQIWDIYYEYYEVVEPIWNSIYYEEVPVGYKAYYREVPVGYKAHIEWLKALAERGNANDEKTRSFINCADTVIKRLNTCPISRYSIKPPSHMRSSLKVIDYVCVVMRNREKIAWIIEGKKKLNYEAVGQVNVLSYLFSRDCPQFSIRKAIVCEESDALIEEYCKKFDIAVFCLP